MPCERAIVTAVGGVAGILTEMIVFEYSNRKSRSFGVQSDLTSDGVHTVPNFVLEEGEVIIGIDGTIREWATHLGRSLLGGFRIHTSRGRYSPYMGNENYRERGRYEVTTTADNPIVGIIRGSGDFCPAIVAVELADGTRRNITNT